MGCPLPPTGQGASKQGVELSSSPLSPDRQFTPVHCRPLSPARRLSCHLPLLPLPPPFLQAPSATRRTFMRATGAARCRAWLMMHGPRCGQAALCHLCAVTPALSPPMVQGPGIHCTKLLSSSHCKCCLHTQRITSLLAQPLSPTPPCHTSPSAVPHACAAAVPPPLLNEHPLSLPFPTHRTWLWLRR